jgi:tRNA-dihydrouridine synthase
LSLARSNVGNYNHHGLELNSETKQTKEQRKHFFWVFQGLTKAKERRNLFGFLQTKRTKKNRQKLQKDKSEPTEDTMKGEESTYSPKLRLLA